MYFFLVLVNDPEARSVNPGCLKCILSINVSPINKNLLTISIMFYLQSKMSPNNGILLKCIFNLKLLNNPLCFCILINLDLLPLHCVYFYKTIIFPLFVFVT